MLVGDHGRVIPFRHFKALAIGVCGGLALALAAVVVLVFLYAHQGRKLEELSDQLKEAHLQSSKLRDEKDLYLTKLMLQQNQIGEGLSKPAPSSSDPKASDVKAQAKDGLSTNAAKKPQAPPPKKAPPQVNWNADIRKFSIDYDANRKVLKAQFRVYNTSKPKRALSGRCVIVFKVADDPPIKWFSVPHVQLNAGSPLGTRGQAFKINNYRTMQLRAYGQKAPIKYNTATIYVFTGEGKLLASKDFAFKIEYQPPVEKKAPEVTQPSPARQIQSPANETGSAVTDKSQEESKPAAAPGNDNNPSAQQPETPQPAVEKPGGQPSTDKKTSPTDAPAQDSAAPSTTVSEPANVPETMTEGNQPAPETPSTAPQQQTEGERQ